MILRRSDAGRIVRFWLLAPLGGAMVSSMEIGDCGTYSTVLVIGSVGWSNGVFHGFKFGASCVSP